MKIILCIRKGSKPSRITMHTEVECEDEDTPRINNFGLEFREALNKIIADAEQKGTIVI